MTREETRTVELIGRIYEAAAEPTLWGEVLRQVAEYVGRPCGDTSATAHHGSSNHQAPDPSSACRELAAHAADPGFTGNERKRAKALIPHLARASALAERLREATLTREAAQASLDCVACGVLVLGGQGQVLFANDAVRRILGERDGIALADMRGRPTHNRHKRLAIEDGAGRAAVDAALAQCLKHPRDGRHHGTIVRRPSGRPPYLLRCTALKSKSARASDEDVPQAIVFITDPDEPMALDTEALKELYGLTNTEASLAERICRGERLSEAASVLTVSQNTARMHLRSIFHKTGVSRQAELIRLALTLSNCR